jgi:hypothetical protein
MSDLSESVRGFCMIQLEILKERRHRLRKDFQDCQIQEEFILSVLRDLGQKIDNTDTIISNLIDIEERKK